MTNNDVAASSKHNSFIARHSIQAVAVNASYVAIACGSYVQIVRLDDKEISLQRSLEIQDSGSFSTTDVAFNPIQPDKLAVAATNGIVAIFNVNMSSNTRSSPPELWRYLDESGSSRAVHRVSWSFHDPFVLASACQDSSVRIFDMRLKNNTCQVSYISHRLIVDG